MSRRTHSPPVGLLGSPVAEEWVDPDQKREWLAAEVFDGGVDRQFIHEFVVLT